MGADGSGADYPFLLDKIEVKFPPGDPGSAWAVEGSAYVEYDRVTGMTYSTPEAITIKTLDRLGEFEDDPRDFQDFPQSLLFPSEDLAIREAVAKELSKLDLTEWFQEAIR